MDHPGREPEDARLREDFASHRLIFETAALGIGLGAPDGRVVEINPFFCEMLGYHCDELVGRSLDVGHPDDEETTTSALARLQSGEVRLLELSGHEVAGLPASLGSGASTDLA